MTLIRPAKLARLIFAVGPFKTVLWETRAKKVEIPGILGGASAQLTFFAVDRVRGLEEGAARGGTFAKRSPESCNDLKG
jgi:hypothetical protein